MKYKNENSKAAEILSHVRASPTVETGLTAEEKVEKIKHHFTEIMQTLGLDLNDDSLKDTPKTCC